MARLNATKDASVERNKSNDIVHKPTSSLAGRSSLAAAATGSTSYKNSNTFVPSFKKNPLNAAATIYTVDESSATSNNNETVSNNKPTIATTNHVTVTPSTTPTAAAQKEEVSTKKLTLIQQLVYNQKVPHKLPPPLELE